MPAGWERVRTGRNRGRIAHATGQRGEPCLWEHLARRKHDSASVPDAGNAQTRKRRKCLQASDRTTREPAVVSDSRIVVLPEACKHVP